MSATGIEYPPLLQPGLHAMTLQQVHDACVAPFPLSVRRPMIFQGLTDFFTELSNGGIAGVAWVNGSFLTEKLDPDDCDLVLCMDGPTLDVAPPAIVDLVSKHFVTDRANVKTTF